MLVAFDDRFDSLIRYHVGYRWPDIPGDWLLVKAQVWQESRFKPRAASKAGAQGLLQLMPATDLAIDGDLDGFEIEGNLDNGIRYLKEQFDRLDEIPDATERLKMALAAYNGGRGYLNRAIGLAATAQDIDVKAGHPRTWPAGRWQTWETVRTHLAVESCTVNGKRPDYQQMWDYVAAIMGKLTEYRRGI